MKKYTDFVLDQAGNALVGASVRVNLAGTGTPATIFSDNGVTAKANPISTSADGNFFFFAANGQYDLVVTKSGYTFNATNTSRITLYDPVDSLAAGAATVGSALFHSAAGISQDNPNLFWDDTNNRLGLGTITPAWAISVVGIGGRTIGCWNQQTGIAGSAAIQTVTGGGAVSAGLITQTDTGAASDFPTTPNLSRLTAIGGQLLINTFNAFDLIFGTGGNAFSNERMRISSTGSWTINSTGPHAIGNTLLAGAQLFISGTFAGSGGVTRGTQSDTTLTPAANTDAVGLYWNPSFTEAGSGTHADFIGAYFTIQAINAGAAALTNASTVKIGAAPTGATNNRALWVSGVTQFDAQVGSSGGSVASFGGLAGKFAVIGYDVGANFGYITSGNFGATYEKLVVNGATIGFFIAASEKMLLTSAGKLAIGTNTVLANSIITAKLSDLNSGMVVWNDNETNAASTPLYLAGENSSGTISNVSIESLTESGASAHFLIRTGGSGAATTNGTERLRVTNTGVLLVGTTVLAGAPAGSIIIANGSLFYSVNGAGTGLVGLIRANSADQVEIAPTNADIKWGTALVALGGGATPTFGTIGGSGPATAAQNTWMRVIDSTGVTFWVPAWK